MARFAQMIAKFAAHGTAGYPPAVARRLRITNITALAAIVIVICYSVAIVVVDFAALKTILPQNALFVLICVVVPSLHRFGSYMSGIVFMSAAYCQLFGLTYLLGTGSGQNNYYFAIAVISFLFFGLEKILLSLGGAMLAAALFLAAHALFPPESAVIMLDPLFLDGIYVFSVVSTFALILLLVYYAFLLMTRAEAAAAREHQRSERLLLNILPAPVAERLKAHEDEIIADSFAQATVLFADIVDFTPLASKLRPRELVAFLNRVFTEFDALADRYGLEKIKTIGDAYMAAGGLPTYRSDHADAMANMALDMLDAARRLGEATDEPFAVRVGINSGPVVAGVIGTRKFSYDVWGDMVNVASRMESTGEPGRIQVSAETRALLGDRFAFEARGPVEVKGKGAIETFFLTGRA